MGFALKDCEAAGYCTDGFVDQVVIDNELLRIKFDNSEDLAFESLTSCSGRWLNEEKEFVDVSGRVGIDIQGHCVLKIPQPIILGEEWTISVWTLAPLTPKHYRNLL